MRALITGVNGFVGLHLEELLKVQNIEVWGTSRIQSDIQDSSLNRVQLEFNNEEEIIKILNDVKPDLIFHLAAQSSVKKSWDSITFTMESNVINAAVFYEAIRRSKIAEMTKVLSIGSSEEYGIVSADNIPIKENSFLNPINPYGISKVSQFMLAKLYASLGMNVVHVRPFNHIGPGQGLGFVTTDFSNQIAKIEAGMIEPIMSVGNLSAKRDFLDVRDIVRAYSQIIHSGIPGEAYNICSASPLSISDVLDNLIKLSTYDIQVNTDESLLRNVDIPLYVGSNEKIKSLIDWKQEIPIEKTLEDTLNFWREKIQKERRV
ncbi:GDP-mannose 4,6-dehydratase [Paenibacillus sp. FSL H8-0261]|uniref:GDP-mannose 4,6-dehydratase n=1 Tax=Paenibacillus sp. FSL H8-0261 TaxID=2921381 RepID=UPI0032496810